MDFSMVVQGSELGFFFREPIETCDDKSELLNFKQENVLGCFCSAS